MPDTIEQLAREIVKAQYPEMKPSYSGRRLTIARLGILEGERRERERIANWLIKLAGDAADALRNLHKKQTLTVAQSANTLRESNCASAGLHNAYCEIYRGIWLSQSWAQSRGVILGVGLLWPGLLGFGIGVNWK